jgi:thymidylate synthase
MITIEARNVNEVFRRGMELLADRGHDYGSRNGRVRTIPWPVCIVYRQPMERMLFCPERDANPFFHIMEGLWMLNGQRDEDFIVQYNKQMAEYANDFGTFDGAYGYRWRYMFGTDQIADVISLLRSNPDTRRAVIHMGYPGVDNLRKSKDVPCNTSIYFRVNPSNNKLDMTVVNRSNDAIWGAFGANAVHMSMLHEVVAVSSRLAVGTYYQFTNNLHAYYDNPKMEQLLWEDIDTTDLYESRGWKPYPIITHPDRWFVQLDEFMNDGGEYSKKLYNPWFYAVARPVAKAHLHYRVGAYALALEQCYSIADPAISHVCRNWIERRIK